MLAKDNFNSHAHVERDDKAVYPSGTSRYFNSHAHVERDLSASSSIRACGKISTHTLTWSVTKWSKWFTLEAVNFNSHAHVERDLSVKFAGISLANFNSHAHVERDMRTSRQQTA